MSTERDRRIEAVLSSTTPPEHRAGFWDDLRDELEESRGTSERILSIPTLRTRLPVVLVAAALIAVVAVVGLTATGGDDGDVDVAVEPEPDGSDGHDADAATMATGDLGPLAAIGDLIRRGDGRAVGVSADGRWLYVADDAGDGTTACEGTPRQALYVEPVDGGERTLAAPAAAFDASTVFELHFDASGAMAAVLQCEGHGARVVTAEVAADGTLSGLTERELAAPDCSGAVDGVYDIAFAGPGHLVAATISWTDGDESCLRLLSLPAGAAEAVVLGPRDVSQFELARDGQIVTASTRGVVSVGDRVLLDRSGGGVSGLSVSPSGAVVAVAGDGDTGAEDVVVPVDGGEPTPFATDAYEVTLLDDVNGLMTAEMDGARVVATFRAGEPDAAVPIVTGNVSTFVVAPDASRAFVTVTDETGENERILEVALTRDS